jgi:hypothetical protein
VSQFLKYFLYVVGAALASSILGAVFACVVALVLPEFVKTLFSTSVTGSLVRYAAGAGMVWGLFLGTAVMAFSLLLGVLGRLVRALRPEQGADQSAK